ncbi:SURF1 family protein [Georgenia sp. AZ-5]|uniref:SURF1 family cytochrome oxidase biogenesis protein n=1 Tax=Georgenia sp. AZ-5 TaxID=3367526 RepID=UPI0037541F66
MSDLPRRSYGFLTTPRWLALIALMVAVSVACVFLARWQWSRYETHLAEARQVEAVYDDAPVALADALDAPVVGPADEWLPVELTGRYVPGTTVLLRNRPVDGTPAAHVLAAFEAEVDGGTTLLVVDRGWLPSARLEAVGAVAPEPPEGRVAVTGRLREAEAPSDRARPEGQVHALDPGQVLESAGVGAAAAAAGVAVLDGYVAATEEDPAAATELGAFPEPSFNYALNLSYTFQWGLFSVGALAALVVLARREAAERAGQGPVRTMSRAELEEDLEVYTQTSRAQALPAGAGPRAALPAPQEERPAAPEGDGQA